MIFLIKKNRYRVVDTIITEKCVFKVDKHHGLTLIELAEHVKIPDLASITDCEFKVSEDLIKMRQA